MRRHLLALAVAAAALGGTGGAATAEPLCAPGRGLGLAGACVQVIRCVGPCVIRPYVDPYCELPGDVPGCQQVDDVFVPIPVGPS